MAMPRHDAIGASDTEALEIQRVQRRSNRRIAHLLDPPRFAKVR